MQLKDLIAGDALLGLPAAETAVIGITADSRAVRPGFVFAAIPGTRVDGATFVPGAVAQGAAAIIAAEGALLPADIAVPVVRCADPRRLLALAAARFYGRQPDHIIAVTGTSGKSSVVDFARQILTSLGREAASLGTIGVTRANGATYGSLTTPDPVTMAETLAGLTDDGVTHLAFEASSHGLDQRRLDGVRIRAAAFTNLGHDHLDYHPSVEDYLAAKLRLFDALLPADGIAVVNADGPRSADVIRHIEAHTAQRLWSVGAAGRELRAENIARDGFRQSFDLSVDLGNGAPRSVRSVKLPLVGAFQRENAIVAAGLVMALGEDPDGVVAALGELNGVPGRLERVGEANGGLAVVDYAHKPDALEAVLTALRPFATGPLVCVVGCGGDRDREKRPKMGAIAARLADVTIITDDNPRTEDPRLIRAAMMAAAPDAVEIGDRREAIREGVRQLGPGGVLVVAGKGHEVGQIVGDQVLPFSDQDEVRAAIADLSGRQDGVGA